MSADKLGSELFGLLKAILWPGVVLVIFLKFKSEVSTLLLRLKSFKAAGAEAEFREELAAATEEKERLALAEPNVDPSSTTGWETDKEPELLQLAQASPDSAVVTAWILFERELRKVGSSLGLMPAGVFIAPRVLIRQLDAINPLPQGVIEMTERLGKLRNLAAHGNGPKITTAEASEYVRNVLFLLRKIRRDPE